MFLSHRSRSKNNIKASTSPIMIDARKVKVSDDCFETEIPTPKCFPKFKLGPPPQLLSSSHIEDGIETTQPLIIFKHYTFSLDSAWQPFNFELFTHSLPLKLERACDGYSPGVLTCPCVLGNLSYRHAPKKWTRPQDGRVSIVI